MDQAQITQLTRDETEAAVSELLASQTPFTTSTISNMVKQKVYAQCKVVPGHRHIRPIIEEIDARGDMGTADFVVSPITVYPPKHGPTTVRLWYPDSFDPADFKDIEATPWTPDATAVADTDLPQQVDMTGDGPDADDSMPVVTNTKSGASVNKQCRIQKKNSTLNIPRALVASAGFQPSTKILISSNNKGGIEIREATAGGSHIVDAEGRVRIHGPNLTALNKSHGDTCLAMVAEKDSVKFILVE